MSGSGSHGPTYVSRRTRAERRWSIARRVVTADSHAFGSRTSVSPSATAR